MSGRKADERGQGARSYFTRSKCESAWTVGASAKVRANAIRLHVHSNGRLSIFSSPLAGTTAFPWPCHFAATKRQSLRPIMAGCDSVSTRAQTTCEFNDPAITLIGTTKKFDKKVRGVQSQFLNQLQGSGENERVQSKNRSLRNRRCARRALQRDCIMIQLFSHYVPARLMVLILLEALVIAFTAYVGISMNLSESGMPESDLVLTVPSQAGVFAVVMMVVLSSMGLYQPDLWNQEQSVRRRLLVAFLVCFAITALVSYFLPFHYQRPLLLGASIVTAGLLGSVLVRAAFRRWHGQIVVKPRVLVLGTGSRVVKLAESAALNPNHQVVGYLPLQPSKHFVPVQQVLPMGAEESLLSIVDKHSVDQIVLGVRDRRGGGFPVQQLLECRMRGVKIVELSTFFEREYQQVLLESLNPSWMVLGDGFRQGIAAKLIKRTFDVTVSALLLVAALPVMLLAALLIMLESGLPLFYKQERVGQNGRAFTIYKFRSMRVDAESGGKPHWAKANDDRTTRVGRFIRKYRIDELPQIINVLKGEMSFVGPRPERPFFVDQLAKQVPFYALRHNAKPGITGWAQVRYPYGASIDDAIEKLQYDLYYVKNHSLFLDLMILLSTVEVVLWGKGSR